MIDKFEAIISVFLESMDVEPFFSRFIDQHQDENYSGSLDAGPALNAAFLINLAGKAHPCFERSRRFLAVMAKLPEWEEVAEFYIDGKKLIHQEIIKNCEGFPDFADRLNALFGWVTRNKNLYEVEKAAQQFWSVFFPEANGILGQREESIESLRAKRMVTITALNAAPILDPARQILFTSNVLLTTPPSYESLEETNLSLELKKALKRIMREPQQFWYDHPVQMGVVPGKNEILYGLRGLEEAFAFEGERGNMQEDSKPLCLLSVSVTHKGLHSIVKKYLEELFHGSGRLKKTDLYVFTETDTQRIIEEILVPAAAKYLPQANPGEYLNVFGVDGEYGRHYSFLKAIAAFWNVFIQPDIKATFKIDLDQVFPQYELTHEAGASAFEHFKTPLWGASGLDSSGAPLELGMIAGALVNESDINRSLFTPDVPFPTTQPSIDEYIFYSTLPQALSTEAEMMTRYGSNMPDGKRTCIQRVHVTGGTNGILLDSLFRFRPFTPTFIGRAEDQAYILSTFRHTGPNLAYVHKDGLIMRHDKEAFAQDAVRSAFVGKLVGDYIRILYFSSYGELISGNVARLKEAMDPFTGCFISMIPTTVVYLRFALKAASFFRGGQGERGEEFIRNGARRIRTALHFVSGEDSLLRQSYERERLGWDIYFDTLLSLRDALKKGDAFAKVLQRKAKDIISECHILFESEQ